MKEEELLNSFAKFCISTSRLLNSVSDKFFAEKISSKFLDFIIIFFKSFEKTGGTNVAQYSIPSKLFLSINSIEDLLGEIQYLKLARQTHLLSVQKNILQFRLDLIRYNKNKATEPKEAKSKRGNPVSNVPKKILPISQKNLSPGKEKILSFIKNFPRSRSREIIDQFKEVSTRTIKRHLQELTQEGYLEKISENNSVYYLARSSN